MNRQRGMFENICRYCERKNIDSEFSQALAIIFGVMDFKHLLYFEKLV